MRLVNARIIAPEGKIRRGEIVIEDGKIARVRFGNSPPKKDDIDAGGNFVAPGFIDLHIHGDPEKISRREVQFGTTGFLWGIHAIPKDIANATGMAAGARHAVPLHSRLAKALGIYLEGPYINPEMRGAIPLQFIPKWDTPMCKFKSLPDLNLSALRADFACRRRAKSGIIKSPSLEEVKRLLEISGENIKVVVIAPELKGALPMIKYLHGRGICVSIGHTNATYEETRRGIDSGASLATHTFNRMSGFEHRKPGAVGAILEDDRIAAEALLDGVHMHPAAFKILLKCKGSDKIVLVTDSTASGPLPGSVRRGGIFRLEDGTFAGSALTMNRAVKNAVKYGASLSDAVKMASLNPARVLGIEKKKGSLEKGKDADIVIFDKKFNVMLTMVEGRVADKCAA